MALANVSLDLLGQARGLYPRVGVLDGTGRSEDGFAMLRDEREWRSVHLVEQERADFGFEMARLLWFSAYQVELYAAAAGLRTRSSGRWPRRRPRRWPTTTTTRTSGWCGSATAPRSRIVGCRPPSRPCSHIWQSCSTTTRCLSPRQGRRGGPSALHDAVVARAAGVVEEATLTLPNDSRWRSRGGRQGVHSAPMGYLLAEMQHLARSHPGATW